MKLMDTRVSIPCARRMSNGAAFQHFIVNAVIYEVGYMVEGERSSTRTSCSAERTQETSRYGRRPVIAGNAGYFFVFDLEI